MNLHSKSTLAVMDMMFGHWLLLVFASIIAVYKAVYKADVKVTSSIICPAPSKT